MTDQPVKSIVKTIEVLKMFAFERTLWGPRDLSNKIGISKSSAQRILSTLNEQKYLIFSKSKGKYTIGHNL